MTWEEIVEIMMKDKRVRLAIVRRSHKSFFQYYFSPDHTEYAPAPFHDKIFQITQDMAIRMAIVLGFRGCAKSTLIGLSFPIWSILGEQKTKYVLIVSKTQQKAQMMLQMLKYVFETNEKLRKDLGPFYEERNGWNVTSLYIPKYQAKITTASTEQSIRSYRHMQYRPQLIICDDLEDLESVKTAEGRDKVYNWMTGDLIPAGNKNTRIFVIGSLLHNDCLIRRFQKEIADNKRDGTYLEIPFLDENGKPAWKSKFPNEDAVMMEKKRIGNEIAWLREYMLQVVPEEGQIVKPEWLKYYDFFPDDTLKYRYTIIGVDPAVSQKSSADCTAMVGISVYGHGQNLRLYVHPNPVNDQISFEAIKNKAKFLSQSLGRGSLAEIIVENFAAQDYLLQELKSINLPAQGFKGQGDKRERLITASALLEQGRVYFPKEGVDKLTEQLLGFGSERYDDLVDALSMLLIHINTEEMSGPLYFFRGTDNTVQCFGGGKEELFQKPKENPSADSSQKGIITVILDTRPPWEKGGKTLDELEKDLNLKSMRDEIQRAQGMGLGEPRRRPEDTPSWFS